MKIDLKNRNLSWFSPESILNTIVASRQTSGKSTTAGDDESASILAAIEGLDLSQNKLHVCMSMTLLRNLKELNISHNVLSTLAGLPYSLQRLNVSSNELSSLCGVEALTSLRMLDASGNHLATVDVSLPTSLEMLVLDNNRLTSFKPLVHLQKLLSLSVEGNAVSHLEDVAVLGCLKSLRHLVVAKNPVCSNPRLHSVLSGIPKLTTLNGRPLSQSSANHLVQQRKTRQSGAAVTSFAQSRSVLASNRSCDSAAVAADAESEVQIRHAQARAKELKRMVDEAAQSEMLSRKRNVELRSQLKRIQAVQEEQQREINQLRSAANTLEVEHDDLERTLDAANKTFTVRHASIKRAHILL